MAQIFSRFSRWHLLWAAPLGLVLIVLALFAFNGLVLARDEVPLVVGVYDASETGLLPAAESSDEPEIKIMAYNLAKGFVHSGFLSFASEEQINARLDTMAELIKQEDPDLLFLSEAVLECGPVPINHVRTLAEKTGMAYWAFGENFNFGLPGYRMTSGNAILSKAPLAAVANPSLTGRQPFYITFNNRRVLFCRVKVAGREVLLGSIHTDSFNLDNNLAQTKQILEFCENEPAILAGDFNCNPDEPSIPLVMETGRFAGSTEDVLTFPADQPDQTLDYIFAPSEWEQTKHRVLESEASDHCPVVATFRVHWEEGSGK